jgi:ribosome biogenesis protein Tsr3
MVQLSGTYENGHITLDKEIYLDKPVKVMVTFIDEDVVEKKRLSIDDCSFAKSRELLKNVKGSISDAVIEERRSEL